MIAKEIKGHRLRGLVEYLYGPGRAEEHADPHLVAAWDGSLVARQPADAVERGLMVSEMEAPARMFNTALPAEGPVYHVPISLHVDDGRLSDEQWQMVAETAVDKLGFSAREDRVGCPWVAVRHGLSRDGRDHIHLAVYRVREDGTVAPTWGDHYALSELRDEMEQRLGLAVRTRQRGAGRPGLHHGEIASAARRGRVEPDRRELARVVRAAATGARDEADFVARVRRGQLLVRPRWAAGDRGEVVGYSVATRPGSGEESPVWFGGGRLAKDLTLPALRQRWPEPDAAAVSAAVQEWRPKHWRRTGGSSQGRAPVGFRAEAWTRAGEVLTETQHKLDQVPAGDTAAWAGAAREAAGVLAGVADRVAPAHRAPLRRAADALAWAGQVDRGHDRGERREETGRMRAVAQVATDAWIAGRGGSIAVTQLIMQLARLAETIAAANAAAGRAHDAALATAAHTDLATYVHDRTLAATGTPPLRDRRHPETATHRSAPERNRDDRGR